MLLRNAVSALALVAAITAPALAAAPKPKPRPAAASELIMLDTHLDTPVNFGRVDWDIMADNSADPFSQVDYPRMVRGGLTGGFFAIYIAQGPLTAEGYAAARDEALMRAVWIREMVARHSDRFALAFAADDAARIAAQHKRVVFQSMENSYPLGEDLTLLRTFYDLGLRLAGPVHFRNNQFADSATDTPRWHGLSPLGKAWVAEANRLGIMIDASHASDDVFDQLLTVSKTPIVLSHSGCKAVFDHPRNLDDGRLRKLAAAGGVIQINSVYLKPRTKLDPATRADQDRVDADKDRLSTLSAAEIGRLKAEQRRIDAKYPPPASFDDFMANLLHALKVAGVDHVGVGADWDGGGGVVGMKDVADLPKINARLRQAGYSEADLRKIWSGNILRVMRQAEANKATAAKAATPAG
ncbi:peptidase M19 [Caulobacter sp. CCUG 60055]|uniref:dipeptidase n=1 Tax=Caulobacter sp. CCUG 60055 TaxID=2100090 RepID=UPI001FA7089D|nr:dipeptidase [Caulobacter sp. CCUG 60055]MCI3180156.1 peptidase M19 [Caulobacter sp. CCUG 60055]